MAGEMQLEEEVWAIELGDTSRGNSEMLSLVAGDSGVIKDKKLIFHLVTFTQPPSSSGSGSKDDPISEHSALSCPGCPVAKVVPTGAIPQEQTFHTLIKTKPRLALNWASKHEEGLLLVAAQLRATRFYIHSKKTAVNAVKKLSLSMPGGCTVMGVCGGKRVAKFTAPSVDLFDSSNPNKLQQGTGEYNCVSEASFSIAEEASSSYSMPASCLGSEAGSPHVANGASFQFAPQSFSDGILSLAPTGLPYSPYTFNSSHDSDASFSAQYPLQRMPSSGSESTGFTMQHDSEVLSGQFILQRPDAYGYHSGPIQFYGSPSPRCQRNSPTSTSIVSSQSINEGSGKASRSRLHGFAQKMAEMGSGRERGFRKQGSDKERRLAKAGSEGERTLR